MADYYMILEEDFQFYSTGNECKMECLTIGDSLKVDKETLTNWINDFMLADMYCLMKRVELPNFGLSYLQPTEFYFCNSDDFFIFKLKWL